MRFHYVCPLKVYPLKCVVIVLAMVGAQHAAAAPVVSRLTPPSHLFSATSSGAPANSDTHLPTISRFWPGQRFDLQATVIPDDGASIREVQFAVDGKPVLVEAARRSLVSTGLAERTKGQAFPHNTVVASLRAYQQTRVGLHTLTVIATQSDGQQVSASGNFEIVAMDLGKAGIVDERGNGKNSLSAVQARSASQVKNVIILLGDGMGAAHRTAARIMARGYAMGKANGLLAMDSLPVTGMVMTSSLNSIVTDSAPGMASYVTGNKADNNQLGVWPDDTQDSFDNPRVEYLSEFLHRTQGKALGLVTTADVADATPAGNAVHSANRRAGSGIVDQFFDDRTHTGLSVLMGGGRKWFLPNSSDSIREQAENGSQRQTALDYVVPADIVAGWGSAVGKRDAGRDLIDEFKRDGYAYVDTASQLQALPAHSNKLLGLFAYSNMNVALDKLKKRRGQLTEGASTFVVDDYRLPDQPMLDEMASKALQVLQKNRQGFVLMIEGASIDKQSHTMDSERWLFDVLEFDRAVQVAKDYVAQHPDTLLIVTADHECSGAAIIGASRVSNAELKQRAAADKGSATGGLRKEVVGNYEQAGFPAYKIAQDGYPQDSDIDRKLLIGYAANVDRYEDWLTNPKPLNDDQQPFYKAEPLSSYPQTPLDRDIAGGLLISGEVEGDHAVHTAVDVPLTAGGRGASPFMGVMDNTDVFFRILHSMQRNR